MKFKLFKITAYNKDGNAISGVDIDDKLLCVNCMMLIFFILMILELISIVIYFVYRFQIMNKQ
jgi:hypothetical protein